MKTMVFSTILVLSQLTWANNPQLKTDREAVNNACSAESKSASCSDEKVGTGLLKCIHKYHQEHKDFKLSDGCKSAIEKLKEDKKQVK